MLGDVKAGLSGAYQPGFYRYYSASHPDPDHQGFSLAYDNTQGNTNVISGVAPIDPSYSTSVVEQYVTNVTDHVGTWFPEAQLQLTEHGKIVNGIRVLRNDPKHKDGEVLPTSEIRQLMFSVQDVHAARKSTNSTNVYATSSMGDKAKVYLKNAFAAAEMPGAFTQILPQSPKDRYKPLWDGLNKEVSKMMSLALVDAKGIVKSLVAREFLASAPTDASEVTLPGFSPDVLHLSVFPEVLEVGRDPITLDRALADYALLNVKGAGLIVLETPGSSQLTQIGFLRLVGSALAQRYETLLGDSISDWSSGLKDLGWPPEDVGLLVSLFIEKLSNQWGIEVVYHGAQKSTLDSAITTKTYSPVFPISDAHGYEVIGSYRYGRDVSIDADGVFAQLHATDPLSMLDAKTVEEIVDFMTKGTPIFVDLPRLDSNNKPMLGPGGTQVIDRVQTSGQAALSYLEQKVVNMLRQKNLSDAQILDMFHAGASNGNPDHLSLGLQNMFRNGLGGIGKIPINNAAYALADLQLLVDNNICDCKASEAAVMLDSFAGQTVIEPDLGSIASFQQKEALMQAGPWRARQDAYRGTNISPMAPDTIPHNPKK